VAKVLVLGLGNILLRDEGLGIRALELLSRTYELPAEVEVCDGGCLGLKLLPSLGGFRRLMVVDAGETRKSPGTIERLEGDEISSHWEWRLSVHETGLTDLLSAAALAGYRFERFVLFLMQPAEVAPGLGLSPVVRVALPQLVRRMAGELAVWGLPLQRIKKSRSSVGASGG
jgi:hydrogenase maturation protease